MNQKLVKAIEKLINNDSTILNYPLKNEIWQKIKGTFKVHPYLIKNIYINDNKIYIYTSGIYKNGYLKYRKYTTFKIVIENGYISDIYLYTNNTIKRYRAHFNRIQFLIPFKIEKKKISEIEYIDAISIIEYLLSRYYNISIKSVMNEQIKYYGLINPIFRKFIERNSNLDNNIFEDIFNISEALIPIYFKNKTNIEEYISNLELIANIYSSIRDLNLHLYKQLKAYNRIFCNYIKSKKSELNTSHIKRLFYAYYIYLHLVVNRLIFSNIRLSSFLNSLWPSIISNKVLKIKNGRYIVSNNQNPIEDSVFTFIVNNNYYHIIHNDFTNSVYDSNFNLLFSTPNLIVYNSYESNLVAELTENKILIHNLENKNTYECIKDIYNLKDILLNNHKRAYNQFYIYDIVNKQLVECHQKFRYITEELLKGYTDYYIIYSETEPNYTICKFPQHTILKLPNSKPILDIPHGIFSGKSKYYFIVKDSNSKEYQILNILGITLAKFKNLQDAINHLNILIKQEKK